MPYIDQETRDKIDPAINALVESIMATEEDDGSRVSVEQRAINLGNKIEGIMNYTITKLLNACMIGGQPRYKKINRIVGVLECVKLEFYRRLAAAYEDGAVAKNGDMPCYSRFFPIQ